MARRRSLACAAITACGLLFATVGVSAHENARVAVVVDAPAAQREAAPDGGRALFALVGLGSLAGGVFVLRRVPTVDKP
jgi:hypothetical protein